MGSEYFQRYLGVPVLERVWIERDDTILVAYFSPQTWSGACPVQVGCKGRENAKPSAAITYYPDILNGRAILFDNTPKCPRSSCLNSRSISCRSKRPILTC